MRIPDALPAGLRGLLWVPLASQHQFGVADSRWGRWRSASVPLFIAPLTTLRWTEDCSAYGVTGERQAALPTAQLHGWTSGVGCFRPTTLLPH